MKHCCDRCGKVFKQKCHMDNHMKRTKECKSKEEQERLLVIENSKMKIRLENKIIDLETLNGKNEKIIEQTLRIKSLEDEVKKLKNEVEKLKSNKPKSKDMKPKEITKDYEKQLQLRRAANKKMIDDAPDDEFPNEQEKQRHLQWLDDLAKAELETESDSHSENSLDYSSSEDEPPPKPKRIIKKTVYSDSDSD